LIVRDYRDERTDPDLNRTQFKPGRVMSVELPYILPEDQSRYLELAAQNPNMLCSEAPPEILQASSFAGDEPTAFLFEFFATGYNQWHLRTHGFSIDFDQERVAYAARFERVRSFTASMRAIRAWLDGRSDDPRLLTIGRRGEQAMKSELDWATD